MLALIMDVTLIVNPYASEVTQERVHAVEQELSRGAQLTTLLTERHGHGVELAAAAVDADALVVFSGDGGFNEVLNGLAADVPVGLLPGGRTSVLPRALGLPRDPVQAARQLAVALEEGRSRTISLGRVNGRRFAFAAGIGFDAELIRRVDRLGRRGDGRRPGDLAFIAEAVALVGGRFGRFEPALDIEGFGRAAFALVAKTDPYTYAGSRPIRVAREARFELGLDLVAPIHVTARTLPQLLRHVLGGGGRPDDVLYGHDLDRVEVRCDRPSPLHVDGEDLGDVTEAVFEAERSAVRVLI
ncbi:MAG TPA: diacylglycerol kinase family protein [Gaiellaceae bacterium]|nr:diacylglycerol kinase family protein [Gaiellaceae bacterium]